MDSYQLIDLARRAVTLTLTVAAPVLVAALVVGLVVSIAQALTTVQDPILSFVPKILVVLIGLAAVGGWMMHRVVEFAREMFGSLP